jgi:signal peptidase I
MAPVRPQDPESNDDDQHSFLREIPILVLLALAVALVIKTFLVQAFFIPSSSMEPTLMPGDRVLVNKLAYRFGDPHRGDVVVFQNPNEAALPDRNAVEALVHWLGEGLGFQQPENEDLIKRVIGLPGDTIAIRHHRVVVNDAPITEPYLTKKALRSMNDYGPVTVPRGELFVMGDNRGNSSDSRVIGFVPEGNVVGRAFVIIWPPGDAGGLSSA